jgi:hypothetical protein
MARRKQTRGKCGFCGKEYAKSGMTRHLTSCPARKEAIAAANQGRGRNQPIYHLQVLDAWGGDYWLHLEMKGSATLEDLDEYLRAIWLECCGHLSAFEIGPVHYTQIFKDSMGWSMEKSMNVQVRKLFAPGMSIPYEYDFGTTSELIIKVLDVRVGKPLTSHPIALMARNDPPPIPCAVCGEPATVLSHTCLWEEGKDFYECVFCDEHIEGEDEEMLVGVYNSPRTGLCGYDGPAEPPY